MSTASITQHPLYSVLMLHGRRLAARLRQVPARRWRLLCMALVLLWIVHNLAQAFWVLFPAPELAPPPLAPPPEMTETAAPSADINMVAIQGAALFGEGGIIPLPKPETEVLPGIEKEAVETSLNLSLQGVIASSDPDNAWAIIADGNNQALYKVGDKMPQGQNVTLVKVMEQRVILDNNGRYESLWLYSKEEAQRRANISQSAREPVPPQVRTRRPAGEPQKRTLPSSAVAEVNSIRDVVRFTAARGNGGMMGYRVMPGPNRKLFDKAGLRPGDIVTAVNGINLDDPRQIRAVYQDLQTATQAELSILRDGKPVSIYISLD